MIDDTTQGKLGNEGASRRNFLKVTAATAGALVGTGALARGSSIEPAPKLPKAPSGLEPVRVGVVGVGGMGGAHCNSLMALNRDGHESVHIVAICDVCQPNREAWVKRCTEGQDGVAVKGYADYHDLLADESIQAVWIATPEHWHARQAIDAIRAGKDVYVEKPMTIDLADAMSLWRVEQSHDRIVQIGTQFVMQKKYHKARELIQADAIGHPTFSQTSYCRNTPGGEWNYYGINPDVKPGSTLDWDSWCGQFAPQPWDTLVFHRWRRYRRYSTGIIGDLLVHVTTPLVAALDAGWPVHVSATGGHYVDKAMENHDQVNLTIQFEKEHTMIVAGSSCNATGLETLIRGHRANLYLGGNNCRLVPEQPYVDDVEPQEFKFPPEPDQDLLRMNLLQCVRTREQPLSPVSLGVKIMVIVDLASRSLWTGSSYAFSPASMTTYNV